MDVPWDVDGLLVQRCRALDHLLLQLPELQRKRVHQLEEDRRTGDVKGTSVSETGEDGVGCKRN